MGGIAAPLLASVSVALVVVVLSSQSAFGLVEAALLLLVVAAVALVATVECAFMARQYVVTPSQMEEWFPDSDQPARRKSLRREQRYYQAQFAFWGKCARVAYNVGILAISAGLVILLVPPGNDFDAPRVLAVVVAGAAFLAELAWVIKTLFFPPTPDLPDVFSEPQPPSPASSGGSGSL